MNASSPKEALEQNTIRILVLGETNTGKTLLIKRLCHELFNDDASAPIFFRSRWSSTVGFYVDTLMRDVDASSDLTSGLDGGKGGSGSGRGVMSTLTSALKLRSPSSASLPRSFATQSTPSFPRTQIIEFYELGSSQSISNGCWLTAQTIPFDGVILVHNRCDVNSLAYLVSLYRQLRGNILRSSPCASLLHQDGSAETSPQSLTLQTDNTGSRPPSVLLVGVELTRRPYLFTPRSDECDAADTADLPDEAYVGANFQEELLHRSDPRQLQKGRRPTSYAGGLWALWEQWSYVLLWVELILRPSVTLSLVFQQQKEQYLKERASQVSTFQSRFTYIVFCAVELMAHAIYVMDQLLYYCMAVVLFGPFQRVAVLQHHRCDEMEAMLRRDTHCVGRINCFLFSRSVLAQSTEEFVSYFNLLYRNKVATAVP